MKDELGETKRGYSVPPFNETGKPLLKSDPASAMAVYSMTGYASVQQVGTNGPGDTDFAAPSSAAGPARIGVEIRSVNSRFLDLSLRLPDALREHETALRRLLAAHCKRGKIELRVASAQEARGSTTPNPTPRQLQQLAATQSMVRDWLPTAAELCVADILRLCQGQPAGDAQAVDGPALLALARRAIDALLESRAAEGARLAQAMLGGVHSLRELAAAAAPLLPALVTQARQRFLDRWRDALALADGSSSPVLPEAAQDRALAEATAFALRIDVAEELTRLASHLDEIERLLDAGGEVGKRLEFLIQELQREANTLGSKSAALELSRIAVDMKVVIEQMREQVQNLE